MRTYTLLFLPSLAPKAGFLVVAREDDEDDDAVNVSILQSFQNGHRWPRKPDILFVAREDDEFRSCFKMDAVRATYRRRLSQTKTRCVSRATSVSRLLVWGRPVMGSG
jgi:hypothetical protein